MHNIFVKLGFLTAPNIVATAARVLHSKQASAGGAQSNPPATRNEIMPGLGVSEEEFSKLPADKQQLYAAEFLRLLLFSPPVIGAVLGGIATPAIGAYLMRKRKDMPTLAYLASLLGFGVAGAGIGGLGGIGVSKAHKAWLGPEGWEKRRRAKGEAIAKRVEEKWQKIQQQRQQQQQQANNRTT